MRGSSAAPGGTGDVPLPLSAAPEGGPWARIDVRVRAADAADLPAGCDGWLEAGARGPSPGRIETVDGPRPGPVRLRAAVPDWPGAAPDLAPGAPAGDAAAFGQAAEDVLLAACHAAALAVAERAGVRVLGIGSLGGAAADRPFPTERAAKIALGHAAGHFARRPAPTFPERVVFHLPEAEAAVYARLIETRGTWAAGRRRA